MIREVTWGVRKAYLASRRRYIILKRGGEKFLTRIPPGVKTIMVCFGAKFGFISIRRPLEYLIIPKKSLHITTP